MQPLEILVPDEDKDAPPPRLAGAFIDCLSSVDASEQFLEVSAGSALSGNAKLRELISTVVKARRFEQLIAELERVSFPAPGSKGELRCVRNGVHLQFLFTEVSPSPKLKWRFKRAP